MPNRIVELYRKVNPTDERSDAKLTLDLAQERPDFLDQDPQFAADYERVKGAMDSTTDGPSWTDYPKQAIGSAIRGATEVIAGVPEALGVGGSMLSNASRKYLGFGLGDEEDPTDQTTYKLAQKVRKVGEKISPAAVDDLQDSFWATKLPETAGSIGAFVASGGLSKAILQGSIKAVVEAAAKDAIAEATAAKLTAVEIEQAGAYAAKRIALAAKVGEAIPTAALGAATQGAGAYDEALAKGATQDQAQNAYLGNLPIGAAMALPAHAILGEGKTLAGKLARDTITGTGVMAAQNVAGNIVARETFDPNREVTAGLGESVAAGGIVTAALSALSHGLSKRSAVSESKETSDPAKATPGTGTPPPVTPDTAIPVGEAYHPSKSDRVELQALAAREVSGDASPEFLQAKSDATVLFLNEAERRERTGLYNKLVTEEKAAAAAKKAEKDEYDAKVEAKNAQNAADVKAAEAQALADASQKQEAQKAADEAKALAAKTEEANKAAEQAAKDKAAADKAVAKAKAATDKANSKLERARKRAALIEPEAEEPAQPVVPQDWGKLVEKAVDPSGKFTAEENNFINSKLGTPEHQAFLKKIQELRSVPRTGGAVEKPVVATPVQKETPTNLPNNVAPVTEVIAPPVPATPKLEPVKGGDSNGKVQGQEKEVLGAQGAATPTPSPFELHHKGVESITDMVGQGDGQLTKQEAGAGKKSSEIFTETDSVDEAWKDASGKGATKKLVAMLSPDGEHVVIGTASTNLGAEDAAGKRVLEPKIMAIGEDGKAQNRPLKELLDKGFKIIGAIKIEKADKHLSTHTPEEWGHLVDDLKQKMSSLRAGAEGAADTMSGVTNMSGDADPNAVPARTATTGLMPLAETVHVKVGNKTVEGAKAVKSTQIERLNVEHAKTLWEEIGRGELDSDDARDTLESLITEKNDKARSAVLSLITEIERQPNAPKDKREILENAAEILSASSRAADESSFAEALIRGSSGDWKGKETGKATEVQAPVEPRANPAASPDVRPAVNNPAPVSGGKGAGKGTGPSPIVEDRAASFERLKVITSELYDSVGLSKSADLAGMSRDKYLAKLMAEHKAIASKYTFTREELKSLVKDRSDRGIVSNDERVSSNAELRSQWGSTIDSAKAAGLDVSVLEGMHERGDASSRSITLTVADPLNPSHDNVVMLFHEVGHQVLRRMKLPEALLMAFHNAMDKMSIPEGARKATREDIARSQFRPIETLMERSGQALTEQGFDPAQARNAAQRIVSIVKRAYMRGLMAIQVSRFGQGHIDPKLAEAYFQERVKAFLVGKVPMSFLSFLGGPKLTDEQRADSYKKSGSGLSAVFNFDTGQMEYKPVVADSVAALKLNAELARFSDRGHAFIKTGDETTINREQETSELAKQDVAAYNSLHEMHDALYKSFERALPGTGIGFDDFLRNFTNADGPTIEKIKLRNAELAANKQAPVDETLKPHDLLSSASQLQASQKAFDHGWNLREHLITRARAAEVVMRNGLNRLAQSTATFSGLMKDRTNAELYLNTVTKQVPKLLVELRETLNRVGDRAERAGVLRQVIGGLEGNADPKVVAHYAELIDGIYKSISTDSAVGIKFTDMLEQVSKLPTVDWKNHTVAEIRDTILAEAPGDPKLEPLSADTPEGKALLATVISFAKTDTAVMELLSMRRSTEHESLKLVNEALKKAMEGGQDKIAEARKLMRAASAKIPRAVRLMDAYEEQKLKHDDVKATVASAQAFLEFHNEAAPGLAIQMTQLDRAIGARYLNFEANNGSTYHVAPKPGATNAEVLASEATFKQTGIESNKEVIEHIRKNQEWMQSIPADRQGATWQMISHETKQLMEVVGIAQHERIVKNSTINYFLGSIVDKMESVGLPSLSMFAKRMRGYLAEKHAAGAAADNHGLSWSAREADAKRALGLKHIDDANFEKLFFQSARSFAEKNPEIRAGYKTDAEAFEGLLPKLRKFLESDRDTAKIMRDNPGGWKALEAWYRQTYKIDAWVMDFWKKQGLKIQQTMPGQIGPDGTKLADKVIWRDPIGSTFFTATRRTNRSAVRMYHDMVEAGWLGTSGNPVVDKTKASDLYSSDPKAFSAAAQSLFTPGIWRDFVAPLATREQSAFDGPQRVDGFSQVALRSNVLKAFDAAGGDAVKFAENLYKLEYVRGTSEPQADFVAGTIRNMHDFFMSLHNEQKEYDDTVRQGLPSPPRLLTDARSNEQRPGEWMEYATYGRHEMHSIVNLLSGQAHLGKGLKGARQDIATGIHDMEAKAGEFDKIKKRVQLENLTLTGKALDKKIRSTVEAEGHSYTTLSQAQRNLEMTRKEQENFNSLMKLQSGLALETRPLLELISAFAGATVQGPGTALLQFADFGMPFAKLGIGPAALRVVRDTAKSFAIEQFRTLAQTFHTQIGWNADRVARRERAGYVDSDARRNWRDTLSGFMNDEMAPTNAAGKAAFKLARAIKAAISTGIGTAKEGETSAVTLKPHALFSQLMLQQQFSFIDGWVGGFEDFINRAADHFKANPGNATDPAFRFTKPGELGYSKGFLGFGDERAFKYYSNALARYGMDLETVARGVAEQRKTNPSAPAINDAQFVKLASVVQNEVTLDASPASRASSSYTNPILRMASPLVSWSIAKSHDMWEMSRNPDMTTTSDNGFKAFAAGMTPYLALVPAAMAMAWLRDQYDEHLLSKKANRAQAGTFNGMVDALSRVGTFGVWGDIGNSMLNRDTERPFSVDNRVFFVSSLLSAKRALQNWYQQGSADYATVYRPLLASLGGSGYLQYAQILNTATTQLGTGPVLESEARITARINAANYLRVAGREAKMDVRVSSGGETMATPIKPFIGQMVMAAYANDHVGFQQAMRSALAAAKEEKLTDPEDAVRRGFKAYSPLRSVFKTEPSEDDYHKLLRGMNDTGRTAVSTAMRLYNGYAEQLGIKADFGKKAPLMALPKMPSLNSVRAMAAGY